MICYLQCALLPEKVEVWARSDVSRHSDPQHVEDTFPLAITYQSDPKEATVVRIRNYISKFYRNEVSSDRLKKALETGIEKGLWELGINKKYHLLTGTFMPGRSMWAVTGNHYCSVYILIFLIALLIWQCQDRTCFEEM